MNDIRTIKILRKAKRLLLQKNPRGKHYFLCFAVESAIDTYNKEFALLGNKEYKMKIMILLWKHRVRCRMLTFTIERSWWGPKLKDKHIEYRVKTIDAAIEYLKKKLKSK